MTSSLQTLVDATNLLSILAAVLSLVAAAKALLSVREAHRAKRVLYDLAVADSNVRREVEKFYKDRRLSDAEVRAIVRTLDRAIDRRMEMSQEVNRRQFVAAKTLIYKEKDMAGHRFFRELAAEVTDARENVA